MIQGIIASLAAAVIGALAVFVSKNHHWLGLLWYRFLYAGRPIRVSFASLLIVQEEGRFVLVRMPRRPEAFGPFGGVYKIFSEGRRELSDLGYMAQEENSAASAAISGDLRGTIPGRSVFKFLRWFDGERGRESSTDCLRRELREELLEIGRVEEAALVDSLRFQRVRCVREGPKSAGTGFDFIQIRQFDVFGLVDAEAVNQDFFARLIEASAVSLDLLVVGAAQIIKGRAGNKVIGHHACYLLGSKASRPELPPF